MKKRKFLKDVSKGVAGIITSILIPYNISKSAGRKRKIEIKTHPQAVARNNKNDDSYGKF